MLDKKKFTRPKWLKVLLRVVAVLLLLLVILVIFIQSKWGQDIIVSKAVTYLEEQIGTHVSLDKLYLTYSGDLSIEGLYMEDQNGDSLVYSKDLQVSLALMPLIRGTKIHIKDIDWVGLNANIQRDSLGKFNFDYILEAFTTTDTATVDTTATMAFQLDQLEFHDFRLNYNDDQQGTLATLELGLFTLAMDKLDLEQMDFDVQDLEFKNSNLVYRQTKILPLQAVETPQTEQEIVLPKLKIQDLNLENLQIDYKVPLKNTSLVLQLGTSALEDADFNLSDAKISLNSFSLADTQINYTDLSTNEIEKDTLPKDTNIPFEWPDYQIAIGGINLVNNKIHYKNSLQEPHNDFNPSDLQIEDLNFIAEHLTYAPKQLHANVEKFTFKDGQRFWLKNIAFDLQVDDRAARLTNAKVFTQRTTLQGDASLEYASVAAFINQPEAAFITLDFPFELDVLDLGYFQADLLKNPYIKALSSAPLQGRLVSSGSLDSLTVDTLSLRWHHSLVNLKAFATSLSETQKLHVQIPNLSLGSTSSDIYRFLPKEDLGLDLPDSLHLSGNLSGGKQGGLADLTLNSSKGTLSLVGNFLYSDAISYAVDLQTTQFDLGSIIQDQKLEPLTVSLQSMGAGTSLYNITASLTSEFDSLVYAGYDLSPLRLNGQITNGEGGIHLAFSDDNVDLSTVVEMDLDSVNSVMDLVVDLKGANLYQLGITKKDIRTAFHFSANLKGNLEKFTLESRLNDGVVIADNNSYDIGVMELDANVSQDQTNLNIDHKILQGRLRSNANPQLLSSAIGSYFKGVVSDSIVVDSTLAGVNAMVNLQMKVQNGPLLNRVFLPGLNAMDTISLALDFNHSEQVLSTHLNIPHLDYQGNKINHLDLDVTGAEQQMKFALNWSELQAGPVDMGDTELKGVYQDKHLALRFKSMDSLVPVVDVGSEVSFKNDSIRFKIDPDELTLNKQPWFIPLSNEIIYSAEDVNVQDFKLSHAAQQITLEHKESLDGEVALGFSFEHFNLVTVMNLLNPNESMVKGILNGQLEVDHLFTHPGMQADLTIEQFEAIELPLGTLSIKTLADQDHSYTLDLSLKEGYVDLDMGGVYTAMRDDGMLDFTIDFNQIQMEALEVLAEESISNADGYISGNAHISGMVSQPIYEGEFEFHQIGFTPNSLSTEFKLEDERVRFDNDGFYLNAVEITDAQGNTFTLDGTIGTEQITIPNFDLAVKADHFKILEATEEENELFFGDVSLSTALNITGDLEIPIVRGDLSIDQGSSFTMVVPESEVDINQREGIVVFVDKSNTNTILTQNQPNSQGANFMDGFDLDVALGVDKGSTLKIIMDKRTGDNLQVTGMGEFSFLMEPNGRMSLSGQYEVEDGHYEASLYNIVKRRFDIAPGSRLTWSGDPLEAQLDLKAIYNVETSASALMASQTVGVSEEVMRSYRQELPFMVYLNIDGELLSPELSFQLDMPEESQGALGGNVYGYIQQLNNQEEELNKQVFSLLVLNRFFPSSGSDGSAGGPASIARDNVNNVLSDQLNTFSNKLMGDSGVNLNFGLDSYTDYQSATPQERTELDINASKSLFDNRLIIQVGSEVDIQGSSGDQGRNAPVIGNVALEYLITKDGRYRLRGYRKNQFESVVDGELIVTGISLIFSKEFNKFKELWEREIQQELQKQSTKTKVETTDSTKTKVLK